jgi:uncharacterized membrane protein
MKESNTKIVLNKGVYYSAPLPEAKQFASYEYTLPGAANRILNMAETQSVHRQNLERFEVHANHARAIMGLVCAFLICLSGIGGSVYLIILNKSIEGSLLGLTTFASIIGAFILGTKTK